MRQDRRRAPLRLLPLEDRSVPSAAGPTLQADPGSYDPHTLLVRLKAGAPQVLAAVAPGAALDRPLALVNGLWTVRLADGVTVPAALAAAKANPFVQYAEPNYVLHVATAPNDPKYTDGTLWGLNKISMPAAWDVRTDGRPTLVAVIDTGVDYTHPDLAANIWTNPGEVPGNGLDDDGNGYVDDVHGYDFVNNDVDPVDDHGHGTHVSGTIGGIGNNGVGVAGINWAARIMPVKVFNSAGNGTTADIIAGLDYAVRMRANVSNHSYGGGPFDPAELDGLQAAAAAGHLVLAAAGNGDFFGRGVNNDTTPFYPASYRPTPDNIIAVAATDSTDHFASFSNYGATSVDLAAPGVNIYSTVPGGYGTMSGTSMATPHVTGAAALIWAADPTLTMSQVRDRILSNTDSIAALNPSRPTVTNGRLNVARAMPRAPALPTLSVSDVSVIEGNSGTTDAVFTVTLSAASADPVTFNFATADGSATAPGDYAATSGTRTFDPGVTSMTVTVPVIGDTATEPNETFTLNLGSPTNATIQDGQGIGTIVDDEPRPSLTIGDASVTEGNSGTTAATFTVTLSAPTDQTVTVSWATANGTAAAGSDYAAASGSLTFAPGETTKTVTVNVTGDTTFEPDETFAVNLSGATNANVADGLGQGTIRNDDTPPTIAISDVSQAEGDNGNRAFTFAVTLSNPSYQTVTVRFATADGTARTGDKDYTAASGTLTFNPGETTKTVAVQVKGDHRKEANETFFVNLSGQTNAILADAQGLGTILNDD